MATNENKGGSGGGTKKLMVSINSLDGNIKRHPFDSTDTIGDVRKFSYERIVQQKDQIPLERTWIEFDGDRIEDSISLGSLATADEGKGSEADLTLSLAWDTSGG
jgi:hypothetical protein